MSDRLSNQDAQVCYNPVRARVSPISLTGPDNPFGPDEAGGRRNHRLLSPYRVGDEAPMRELPWEAE